MQIKATILLSIGLLLVSVPLFAGPPTDKGVTRTQIEGEDNWGWDEGPSSAQKITCPGGVFLEPFNCSDSMTGRLHLRDGAGWSCMTSFLDEERLEVDERLTGIGVYTSNGNFDVDSNGPVWGEWKLVPMAGCDKNAHYPTLYEDLVNNATSFWHGTWNGRRQSVGQNIWVGELKVVGKGIGVNLDGLQFKGTMWITTYTPFPIPYEYIFPYEYILPDGSRPFDMPEAYFIGTIKE